MKFNRLESAMEVDQLSGRYVRLKQELATAYVASLWRDGLIDRLANELASVERQLLVANHASRRVSEPMLQVDLVGQTG